MSSHIGGIGLLGNHFQQVCWFKGKKPKIVDDDECETSKQDSKKGDVRKAVNETLSKAVKERWDKRRNMRKRDCFKLLQTGYPMMSANSVLGTFMLISRRDGVEEIKMLDEKAHEWLVERNPNSWCRAYFEKDRCSAAFENGILKSFNSRIVGARGKPIITMLEEIKVFNMQRMFCMNKLAFNNKDSITPSVRRQMEYNKRIQREVEVRRRDQSLGVNLHQMKCVCNMWQLSGIPYVLAMVMYTHMKMNLDLGVDECQPLPLPPIERKMPRRTRKRRIRHPTKDEGHVATRVVRVMHCHKCWKTGHNKTRCPNQERPKHVYLRSKGIVFREAPSSSMLPPTAKPSTSNIMPPPPTPSTSNTMPPPPTSSPSTSNTMPPLYSSNTIPPAPTPSGLNTMPSHATLGSNTSACSNTMSSHAASASTGTNKGKSPLIPKKRGRPTKSSAFSSRGGSRGGPTNIGGFRGGATSRGGSRGDATSRSGYRGGSRGGASKRGRGSSKRGRCSNTIPFQGLRDESSDEEHQFKMDMKVVYEIEREQMAIDEDDQFWEECIREFDHVKDVATEKQPMTEYLAAVKKTMIEDEPLKVRADLPTQESTVKANLKPTRSKKSKAAEVPNQMRIFHKNKGSCERIFNQKMRNFMFDKHGTGSTPDKAFDVEWCRFI
nr:hypothetical protein [Tanacetum cinerariifolium]